MQELGDEVCASSDGGSFVVGHELDAKGLSLGYPGFTASGRATCKRLDMNDDEGSIIKARRLWLRGGCHPPETGPVLQE